MKKNYHTQHKKKLLILFYAMTTLSIFAQDLFFEASNGTTTTFGDVDVFVVSTSALRQNLDVNTTFNKSDGWELVAIDGNNYYFQITDESSANYGQIDIWNNDTNTRSNYGSLNAIFNNPNNWTLGGADNGLLYFGSKDNNSEIVSWNGTSTTHFANLSDVVALTQYWRLAGFHNGLMYIEWTKESNTSASIKTYNGIVAGPTYDNAPDIYDNYDDAFLFGVSDYIPSFSNEVIVEELNKLNDHISGTATLSAAELNAVKTAIEADGELFINNEEVIALGLEIVALYETNNGGLFTTGTTTLDGFNKTASGYELENAVLSVMQLIVDNSYTNDNLVAYPNIFNNVLFETSSFFPGAVAPPSNSNISYTRQINGTHIKVSGTQPNYVTEDARRPTGCYLAPGSLATVTVPQSLVGTGASILVGAHTWDLSNKDTYKRMDRVTITYPINSTTITIGSPLGGGIYINVPYQQNLGILDITLQNVVRSPYYARTAANQTSSSDWTNIERLHDAPWTDIETDKVMFQVPTSWISAHDGLESAIDDWDISMDAISDLLGRPHIRSKTVVYAQVDVIMRGDANFPGYPQSNVTYDPYVDYGGYNSHLITDGPREKRGYLPNVFFHELGHAEKIYKFVGEIESFVNFLWVPVYNKKFGVDINTAFEESFNGYGISHSIEEAAISWMIAENFRLGNPMSNTTGEFRQELSYQPRGHAKYADLVRLLGWETIEQHYANVSESYDNGEINYDNNVNNVPIDDRILRMSQAAGYDLRPLMHFWGMHPVDTSGLAASIVASNLQESVAIYDQLEYYKTIVPMDNEAFQAFGLNDYSENQILNSTFFDNVSMSYNEGFLHKWWNSYSATEALTAVNQVQEIIDLYFPNGRPEESSLSINEIELKHHGLKIYPIPTKDRLMVDSNNGLKFKSIEIHDVKGSVIEKLKVENGSGENFSVDTSTYAEGVYFLKIYSEFGYIIKKFIVVN